MYERSCRALGEVVFACPNTLLFYSFDNTQQLEDLMHYPQRLHQLQAVQTNLLLLLSIFCRILYLQFQFRQFY